MEINFQRPLAPSSRVGFASVGGLAEQVVQVVQLPLRSDKAQGAQPTDPKGAVPTQQADALQQAVDKLQRRVQISASNLNFSVDRETGQVVVKVIDGNTQEVIRQIPPQEMLELGKALDRMLGLLLNKRG